MLKPSTRIGDFVGIFFISFAMLMFQVLLTRVLSVTLFYHFAFIVVSLAMFGLALGAVAVSRFIGFFPPHKTTLRTAQSGLSFGWCALIAMYLHRTFPSSITIVILIIHLLLLAFTLGGICVCLCLTRNPERVSGLYAADLVGSAFGSLAFLLVLPLLNGPAAVLVVLCCAAIGTMGFLYKQDIPKLKAITTGTLVFGLVFLGFEVARPAETSLFRLPVSRSGAENREPLFERWNSFSRVTVRELGLSVPFGWGISRIYDSAARIEQKYLEIDSGASTPLTKFNGSFENLGHLKADITNLVYYLKPSGAVFVVGMGGGRDILSSLMFGATNVTGVEINGAIIEATRERFAEFVGRLLNYPQVRVVHDEARSYISREATTYDVIQISLVDTFAAASGGAFVLSENSLYTVEAWRSFLKKLKPGGMLSVSRWWIKDSPAEGLRTIALARAALLAEGITQPEKHILAAVNLNPLHRLRNDLGVISVLISPDEISREAAALFQKAAALWDFEILLTPTGHSHALASEIISHGTDSVEERLSIKISAPTDGAPFFFHMAQFKEALWGGIGESSSILISRTLFCALLILILLICILLLLPSKTIIKPKLGDPRWKLLVYFSTIGLGFMFIEISQIQLFSTFLGHPTYGISVVLFSLLLSTGVGSYLSGCIGKDKESVALLMLGVVIGIAGFLSPLIIAALRDAPISWRIMASILLLCPLGTALGIGFPLGMRVIERTANDLAVLAWGLNGGASVVAGIGAVLVSIHSSIAASYWCGAIIYAVAIAVFLLLSRDQRQGI